MYSSEVVKSMPAMLGVINPNATGNAGLNDRLTGVLSYFLAPNPEIILIKDQVSDLDISKLDSSRALVYSDGGDRTVGLTAAAIIGVVPNDMEATARNFRMHEELASTILYFAGAGGNANNWPLSAHGKYAVHPDKLPEAAQIQVGYHRPILYEVLDEQGNIVRSDVATSCIGLGGAADAADKLEAAKPQLNGENKLRREYDEAKIALGAAYKAASFSATLSRTFLGTLETHERLADINGLEMIKSRRYAKQGRTGVNIDDTRWQPVITRHLPNRISNVALFADTLLRLKFGLHQLSPDDLNERALLVHLESDDPVKYHADGDARNDVQSELLLLPGQTMRMRLAQIAIPTVMVR